jgi:hypothetical protein
VQGKKQKTKGIKKKQKGVPDLDPCTLNLVPLPLGRRPCPDCRFCQGCSQDRCRLCRSSKKTTLKKLSMAEQIALYERINKKKMARKK